MFNFRTLKAFARAPLIPPQPAYQVVPMATFRTYAPQSSPEGSNENTEQTSSGAPSTDDIAHSDGAFGGAGANPKESAKKIENENEGSMAHSAANPDASKPPNKDQSRPAKETRG
ncbi:hypothetical protein FRB95_006918 [Tulasnella sp. JGI-2019a]|nr:hypothetical protein FRB95_006918 [Tulasnella sp. JGI-2019a]